VPTTKTSLVYQSCRPLKLFNADMSAFCRSLGSFALNGVHFDGDFPVVS
jgi:hypothetical protein